MTDTILAGTMGALATVIAVIVAFFLSNKYQKYAQKVEDDRIMKDLFKEFNERFDKINGSLLVITKLAIDDYDKLMPEKRIEHEGVIMDFFNICSEEYFWYQEGRINSKIWKSWHKGMNDIYNKSLIIQRLWLEESNNEGFISYYLNAKNNFFENA